jgi:hypothetical protein
LGRDDKNQPKVTTMTEAMMALRSMLQPGSDARLLREMTSFAASVPIPKLARFVAWRY